MTIYTRFNTLVTAVVIFGLWLTVRIVLPDDEAMSNMLLVCFGTAIGAALPSPKK